MESSPAVSPTTTKTNTTTKTTTKTMTNIITKLTPIKTEPTLPYQRALIVKASRLSSNKIQGN